MSAETVTRPTTADMSGVMEGFAALLRDADGNGRKSPMSQANMRAMSDAPEEAFDVVQMENLADVAADEPPAVLVPGVIVEGQVTWMAGHPAHGKTTIAMHAALVAARAGRDVLWLDWEGGRRPTARRLLAMGARAADFERIHYAGFVRLGADADGLSAILSALDKLDRDPVVVFDSASKALAAAGLDENSPTDATKWTTEVVMPLRERATVIVIDHVTKGATRTTPYARGAGSKLADTEVFWYVEAEEKFSRERPGTVLLTKHKDREGVLPERVRFKVGDGKGGLPVERIDLDENGDEDRSAGLRARILNVLRQHDGEELSARQVVGMVTGKDKAIRDGLRELTEDASVPVAARPGSGRTVLYRHDAAAVTALEVTG